MISIPVCSDENEKEFIQEIKQFVAISLSIEVKRGSDEGSDNDSDCIGDCDCTGNKFDNICLIVLISCCDIADIRAISALLLLLFELKFEAEIPLIDP